MSLRRSDVVLEMRVVSTREHDVDAEPGRHLGDGGGVAPRGDGHEQWSAGAGGVLEKATVRDVGHRKQAVVCAFGQMASQAEPDARVSVQLAQRCGIGLRIDRAVDVDETRVARQGSI